MSSSISSLYRVQEVQYSTHMKLLDYVKNRVTSNQILSYMDELTFDDIYDDERVLNYIEMLAEMEDVVLDKPADYQGDYSEIYKLISKTYNSRSQS